MKKFHLVLSLLFLAPAGYSQTKGNTRKQSSPQAVSPTNAQTKPHQQTQVETGILKGRIVDADGNPLSGVKVFANNTLYYNMNAIGISDVNGYYRIPIDDSRSPGGTWLATAQIKLASYTFDLTVDNSDPFAGNTGAIRNFQFLTPRGTVIYHMQELFDPRDGDDVPLGSFSVYDIELTLTPVGPLVDGSKGSIIKRFGQRTGSGSAVPDVPIGRYKVTAQYAPKGKAPLPLQIQVQGKDGIDDFFDEREIEFETIGVSAQQVELVFRYRR